MRKARKLPAAIPVSLFPKKDGPAPAERAQAHEAADVLAHGFTWNARWRDVCLARFLAGKVPGGEHSAPPDRKKFLLAFASKRGEEKARELAALTRQALHGSPCPDCRGAGLVSMQPCASCHAVGYVAREVAHA